MVTFIQILVNNFFSYLIDFDPSQVFFALLCLTKDNQLDITFVKRYFDCIYFTRRNSI